MTPTGINNSSDIAGYGLVLNQTGIIILHSDGSQETVPFTLGTLMVTGAINFHDAVVGGYRKPGGSNPQAFLWEKETSRFTTIAYPGASVTEAVGINDGGFVVGVYALPGESGVTRHSFLRYPSGGYVNVDEAGWDATQASGINDLGQITGTVINIGKAQQGFVRNQNGAFRNLAYPGAAATLATGIDQNGYVAGWITLPSQAQQGFVMSPDGTFYSALPPGAPQNNTVIPGMNDLGTFLLRDGSVSYTGGISHPTFSLSMSPGSGSGNLQTFTFAFSGPNGPHDLSSVYVEFYSNVHGCYIYYVPAQNMIYLRSDDGTQNFGMTPGFGGRVYNSQCSISSDTISVTYADNKLLLTLPITFLGSFTGLKPVSLREIDGTYTSSGWVAEGSWIPEDNQRPTITPLSPSSLTGNSKTLTLTYSDANGWQDLSSVYLLVNNPQSITNACYFYYLPHSNTAYLRANNGTTNLAAMTPGGSGTDTNSQCSIAASSISVSHTATDLTLHVTITAQPGFTGPKNVYLRAIDNASATSGIVQAGSWTP